MTFARFSTLGLLAILLTTAVSLNLAAAATDPLADILTNPPAATDDTTSSAPAPSTPSPTDASTTSSAPTALEAVANVTIQSTDGKVSLAWDAVADADNYTIHYGQASIATGDYAALKPVGNVTTYTFDGLAAGTYYFAVTAENIGKQIGSAYFSKEVSATLGDAAVASTAPTGEQKSTETLHGSAPKLPNALPQSGPEVAIIVLAVTSGAYVFRRLRR